MKKNKVDAMKFLGRYFPDNLTPGRVVRARRKALQLTPQELQDLTGIDKGHLSRIENGKKPIGVKIAVILGAVLGLHPSTILFPEEETMELYVENITKIRNDADNLIKKKRAAG